jgi:hypothetical protein
VRSAPGKACPGKVAHVSLARRAREGKRARDKVPGPLEGFPGRRSGEGSRQVVPGKSKRARDEVPGPLPGKAPVTWQVG